MSELGRGDREFSETSSMRTLRMVLAVLLPVLFTAFLLWGLWSFVAPTAVTERKEFVQATAVLVAALVALIGLLFTAQNAQVNRKTLLNNLEITRRTLELSEQGQITERFTRAIDQLGATDAEGKPSSRDSARGHLRPRTDCERWPRQVPPRSREAFNGLR